MGSDTLIRTGFLIKEDKDFHTTDFFYDLFDGGYIHLDELLYDPEDIEKVKQAIAVIDDFRCALEDTYPEGFL